MIFRGFLIQMTDTNVDFILEGIIRWQIKKGPLPDNAIVCFILCVVVFTVIL